MNRSASPISRLAEQAPASAPETRVTRFDFAFLATAFVVVAGGCVALLDMAEARSTGADSFLLRMVTDAGVWVPALAKVAAKYSLLFLASVLNSALIVALVHNLRRLDRRLTLMSPRFTKNGLARRQKPQNVRCKRPALRRAQEQIRAATTTAAPVRDDSNYLLSPVFR